VTQSLAIYIHWPFCQSKCPYCDFNSHVATRIDHDAWRTSYQTELAYYARLLPERRISSIFFGGGTPSLMEPKTVDIVLTSIRQSWPLANNVEITLEANPTSVEAQSFADFYAAGVNRLSLGVQSLRDDALHFLGRGHTADQARQAIELATRFFPRFSFDLIYARNDQTTEDWHDELSEALALARGHLSLYILTLEPNTLFYTRAARGEKLTAPDDHAATLYELTQDLLCQAGMPAYEISNYASPGEESRHNLAYWHYDDYIGIGPGAHGRHELSCPTGCQRFATDNHRSPDVWMRQVCAKGHGVRQKETLDLTMAQREAFMMGLRLNAGLSHHVWREKFGTPLNDFLPRAKIERLRDEGYLTDGPHAFKATKSGLQRLNAMLNYLLN